MSEATMREAWELVLECVRDGFHFDGLPSAREEACRRAAQRGIVRSPKTLTTRVHRAMQNFPEWLDEIEAVRAETAIREQAARVAELLPGAKPRVRTRAYTQHTPPEGPQRRVIAVGDIHDAPGKPKDHLRCISRFIAERRPDNVVQIGDFFTLDSLSSHDKPGSKGYYERPPFPADMESAEEAMAAFHGAFQPGEIPCAITLGNHEYRATRAEENAPNLEGTIDLPIRQLFARYRWNVHDYGAFLFLDSVGFVHIPMNATGREFRGEHVENQIGPRAVFSIVMGHSHKHRHLTFPKIGPNNRVTIVNTGTAMPYGVVEHYAGLSVTGWTYGVVELVLQAGQIVGHSFVGMQEICERYA